MILPWHVIPSCATLPHAAKHTCTLGIVSALAAFLMLECNQHQ